MTGCGTKKHDNRLGLTMEAISEGELGTIYYDR